jgi:hypothetical protein
MGPPWRSRETELPAYYSASIEDTAAHFRCASLTQDQLEGSLQRLRDRLACRAGSSTSMSAPRRTERLGTIGACTAVKCSEVLAADRCKVRVGMTSGRGACVQPVVRDAPISLIGMQ